MLQSEPSVAEHAGLRIGQLDDMAIAQLADIGKEPSNWHTVHTQNPASTRCLPARLVSVAGEHSAGLSLPLGDELPHQGLEFVRRALERTG